MSHRSNVGEVGDESIRIGGQTIEELNPRARAEVQSQQAAEAQRKKRREILKRYPPYDTAALEVGIRNSETAIKRFEECISTERSTITEYTIALRHCVDRDKELKAAGCEPR